MGNVVVVSISGVQAVRAGVAVSQSAGGFGTGAFPTHDSVAGHVFGAASVEEVFSDSEGGVAVQQAELVVRIGVGEPCQMVLGQINGGGGRLAGRLIHDAMLNHVSFDGSNRAKGPAGAVEPLIADRSDVAVVAAVVTAGKGFSGAVRLVCAACLTFEVRICHCTATGKVNVNATGNRRTIFDVQFFASDATFSKSHSGEQCDDHGKRKQERNQLFGVFHTISSYHLLLLNCVWRCHTPRLNCSTFSQKCLHLSYFFSKIFSLS